MKNYNAPNLNVEDVFPALYKRTRKKTVTDADAKQLAVKLETEMRTAALQKNFSYASTVPQPPNVSETLGRRLFILFKKYQPLVYFRLRDRVCCYCSVRRASTLDHYYEKSTHPFLAITPINLVPACSDCNTALRNSTEKFHAYFDEPVPNDWLEVQLFGEYDPIRMAPPGLYFRIRTSSYANPADAARMDHMFQTLDLSQRWAMELGPFVASVCASIKDKDAPEMDAELAIYEDTNRDAVNRLAVIRQMREDLKAGIRYA